MLKRQSDINVLINVYNLFTGPVHFQYPDRLITYMGSMGNDP